MSTLKLHYHCIKLFSCELNHITEGKNINCPIHFNYETAKKKLDSKYSTLSFRTEATPMQNSCKQECDRNSQYLYGNVTVNNLLKN